MVPPGGLADARERDRDLDRPPHAARREPFRQIEGAGNSGSRRLNSMLNGWLISRDDSSNCLDGPSPISSRLPHHHCATFS